MGKWIINIAKIFIDKQLLMSISKLLKTNPRGLFKMYISKPETFAKKLGQIGAKNRKKFSEALEKATIKTTETQNLKSSWIKKGSWTPIAGGLSGNLTIWTKKGKTGYTYPGVGYDIWKSMKGAKGRNGSGAGSVFWALYLRQFKNSTFGQFLKKIQKLSGIKGFKL